MKKVEKGATVGSACSRFSRDIPQCCHDLQRRLNEQHQLLQREVTLTALLLELCDEDEVVLDERVHRGAKRMVHSTILEGSVSIDVFGYLHKV
jgi:hypothetical protein